MSSTDTSRVVVLDGKGKQDSGFFDPAKSPDNRFAVPTEDAFGKVEDAKGRITFNQPIIPADRIVPIAQSVISRFPRFAHLKSRRIEYVWKAKGGKAGGNLKLGQAQKPNPLLKYYAENPDFIIWFAADNCRAIMITNEQMQALVYHELCHCGENEKGEPKIEPHEIEGFISEYEEFGAWAPGTTRLKHAFSQQQLDI